MVASSEEWPTIVADIGKLKALVRIKLEDKNDLRAAEGALELCVLFFRQLAAHAASNDMEAFELLQDL